MDRAEPAESRTVDRRSRVDRRWVDEAVRRVEADANHSADTYMVRVLGRRPGASTDTNVWGALQLVTELRSAGRAGSVVTLLCDAGERYAHTYYDDQWLAAPGLDVTPYAAVLEGFLRTGEWAEA